MSQTVVPFHVPYDKIEVGIVAENESFITEESIMKFSAFIGDTDSFHASEENAAKTVFGKKIAHGVHLLSFISVLIGQKLPGFGTIYISQTLKFYKPVYPDTKIIARVKVLEKMQGRRVRLKTIMYDEEGDAIFSGIAVVKTYR